MTYTYKTTLGVTLLGLAFDRHVPMEICYDVDKGRSQNSEDPGQPPSVSLTKVTLTGSDGTRYRAHAWLWEILDGDTELEAELLAEANAADEAAADAKSAVRL